MAGDPIARIDRLYQNLRDMIDTDNSISPCVRATLHALLDEDLVLAKARILDHIAKQEAQRESASLRPFRMPRPL
ncbi:hypothetical protein [Bradyrhizobium sp. USDA 10063]